MTAQVKDVTTRVGLLIGGDVVGGGRGTYPVTNPARPAEVVFDAPATSPAQLDLAVDAARRSQAAWAALPRDERAAQVVRAAEAGLAAVEALDLARLLTPRARQDPRRGGVRHGHAGRHGGRLRTGRGRGARSA